MAHDQLRQVKDKICEIEEHAEKLLLGGPAWVALRLELVPLREMEAMRVRQQLGEL